MDDVVEVRQHKARMRSEQAEILIGPWQHVVDVRDPHHSVAAIRDLMQPLLHGVAHLALGEHQAQGKPLAARRGHARHHARAEGFQGLTRRVVDDSLIQSALGALIAEVKASTAGLDVFLQLAEHTFHLIVVTLEV